MLYFQISAARDPFVNRIEWNRSFSIQKEMGHMPFRPRSRLKPHQRDNLTVNHRKATFLTDRREKQQQQHQPDCQPVSLNLVLRNRKQKAHLPPQAAMDGDTLLNMYIDQTREGVWALNPPKLHLDAGISPLRCGHLNRPCETSATATEHTGWLR